jgi:hypothetical protein
MPDYLRLLPMIDGRVFRTSGGEWTTKLVEIPPSDKGGQSARDADQICYVLDFSYHKQNRRLRLWLSDALLRRHAGGRPNSGSYHARILKAVQRWLEDSEGDGELRSPARDATVIENQQTERLCFVCSKRLDEVVGLHGKRFPAKFKTRKEADKYCRELKLRKPPYHPGYYVEEQDVQQAEESGSTETLDFNP